MNKKLLVNQILDALKDIYQGAIDAANRAHASATSDESVAENKYDTFGLEASYLAHGQSQRVAQCQSDIEVFNEFSATINHGSASVLPGSLIAVINESDVKYYFFLSPCAGGMKLTFDQQEITCITPSAPIGAALLGKEIGDEIEIIIGNNKHYYEIISLF